MENTTIHAQDEVNLVFSKEEIGLIKDSLRHTKYVIETNIVFYSHDSIERAKFCEDISKIQNLFSKL